MKALGFILLLGYSAFSAERDWIPLFNGRDLSNWVPVNVAPGTFSVRDGIIVSTGKPTGVMRTDRQYENFELQLDYKHVVPGGNAGFFVWADPVTAQGVPFTRAIEVQILDGQNTDSYTSHGDLFSIHGARMKPDRPHPQGWERCLPSERRAKPAGEWNHYDLVCSNGVIQLAVNGKVVSGASQCRPRKGYLCLESEGSETHFRNIRIRELPSSDLAPDEIAPAADGFVSIYDGLTLNGWKHSAQHEGHWKPADWLLDYDGKCPAQDPHLWSEKSYRNFVLICDWRWKGEQSKRMEKVISPTGDDATNADGSARTEEIPGNDSGIFLRGNDKSQVNIWCSSIGSGEVYGYRTDTKLPREIRAAVTPRVKADRKIGEWNRFVITMRGEELTVVLNGQKVVEDARLPGVPMEGPIALQHHNSPIEFANIYVKELP